MRALSGRMIRAAFVALSAAAPLFSLQVRAQDSFTWTGAAGTTDWTDAANWDGPVLGAVPDSGDTARFPESAAASGGGATRLVNDATLTISSAGGASTVSVLGEGQIANTGVITFFPDALDNSSSGVPDQVLRVPGSARLTGGGTVRFNGIATGIDGASSGVLTNVDNTIAGNGTISRISLVNESLVLADDGVLDLRSLVDFDNTRGAVRLAATGSLGGGSEIRGGVVDSLSGSVISLSSFRDVRLSGTPTVGGTLTLSESLENPGVLAFVADTLDNGTQGVPDQHLRVPISARLTGGGTVRFNGIATGIDGASSGVLTNADNTIAGNGTISRISLVNESLVLADDGVLDLRSLVDFDNTRGVVRLAATGSLGGGSEIRGGIVDSLSGSVISLSSFRDVRLSGTPTVGGTLTLSESLENPGVLTFVADTLDNGAQGVPDQHLRVPISARLTGGGTVRFNGIATGIDGASSGVLTNADNTIAGNGTISRISLVNEGVILADSGVLTLNGIDVSGAGSIRTAPGGTLRQIGGTVSVSLIDLSRGGTYELATAASRLEPARIVGSLLQTGGTVSPAGFSTFAENYVLSGGALEIQIQGTGPGDFDRLHVGGGLSLDGGELRPRFGAGFAPGPGMTLEIIDVSGPADGEFANYTEGGFVGSAFGADVLITYRAGDGNDVALFTTRTPGSVSFAEAGMDDHAYFIGTRAAVPGSVEVLSFAGLDLLPGSHFTLGARERLELGSGGSGILHVGRGTVFTGNGVVRGTVLNEGLVRIPLEQWLLLSRISGGTTEIFPMAGSTSPGDPVSFVLPAGVAAVLPGSYARLSRQIGLPDAASSGGGFTDGRSGGFILDGDAPVVSGTLAFDASLQVTGEFVQTDTGALRLFVAGDQPGESYSQLRVGGTAELDGSLQIVLQPELFSDFVLEPGASFDFVQADGGISVAASVERALGLVTVAGSTAIGLDGLTLEPWNSGIDADPDELLQIREELFAISLEEGSTVLRATYLGPAIGPDLDAARATGRFLGGIAGATYTFANLSGIVAADGSFEYQTVGGVPEPVAFSIGGVPLGSAVPGASALTPGDLLGASDQSLAVQNLTTLLLLFDGDQDPSNGLALSEAVREFLRANPEPWSPVDFESPGFESQKALLDIAADLASIEGAPRPLPGTAPEYLERIYRCRASGLYTGTFTGDDAGPLLLGADGQGGRVGGFGFSRGGMIPVGLDFGSSAPLRNDGTGSFTTSEIGGALVVSGTLEGFEQMVGHWRNNLVELGGSFELRRLAGTDQDFLRFGIWFGGGPSLDPRHYGLISLHLTSADEVTAIAVNALGQHTPLSGVLSGSQLQLFGSGGLSFSGVVSRGAGEVPTFVGFWSDPAIGVSVGEAVGTGCRLF